MAHKLLIDIDMFSTTPLYKQVSDGITKYVASGLLTPGERLPSLRALAKQLRLSVDTIRQAISVLLSEGLIVSRPGSGYYIGKTATPAMVENSAAQRPSEIAPEKGARNVSLNMSEAGLTIQKLSSELARSEDGRAAQFDFRVGEPVLSLLQGPRLARSLKRWCLDALVGQTRRSDAAGLPELRREIAIWLKRTRGLDCSAEEIFITANAQQSRDVIASLLTNKGAEVLIENPGDKNAWLTYAAHGAKILTYASSSSSEGVFPEELSAAHVLHLCPAAGYPSGVSMPLERRRQVIEWAQRHDVTIVEDSTGEGYSYGTEILPGLAALARQSNSGVRIVYMGSFSEHLPASLSLGFVVVPGWLRDAFYRAKWLTERFPSLIVQELVLSLMASGVFEQHCSRLLEAMRRRRQAVLTSLSQWPAGLVSFESVQAGLQQPLWLTHGANEVAICKSARSHGIALTPISSSCKDTMKGGLALCFSRMSEEEIKRGMERLRIVIQDNISFQQTGLAQSRAGEVADTTQS